MEWAKSTNQIFSADKREVCFTADKHVFFISLYLYPQSYFTHHQRYHNNPSYLRELLIFSQIAWQKKLSLWEKLLTAAEMNAGGLLTLLAGVWFCCHLDIIGGQQACDPVGVSFPPVRIGLVQDADQLSFGEAQLIPIGSRVVVHRDNLAHWGIRGEDGVYYFICIILNRYLNTNVL